MPAALPQGRVQLVSQPHRPSTDQIQVLTELSIILYHLIWSFFIEQGCDSGQDQWHTRGSRGAATRPSNGLGLRRPKLRSHLLYSSRLGGIRAGMIQ